MANIINGITITSLVRLYNSRNGNPRYRVTFDSGLVAETESDGAVNYGIGNSEYKDTPLTVTLTKYGRITYIKRNDE